MVRSVTAGLQGDRHVLGHPVYGSVHYKTRNFTSQQKHRWGDKLVSRGEIIPERRVLLISDSVTGWVSNDVSSILILKDHIPIYI